MNQERRVCPTCHATIPAGVIHACPPKVEDKEMKTVAEVQADSQSEAGERMAQMEREEMTEEEKDVKEFEEWNVTQKKKDGSPLQDQVYDIDKVTVWHLKTLRKLSWLASRQKMREEMKGLRNERDSWIESARQFLNNQVFYSKLLDETAQYLGKAVYVSDDGSIQDSPIRLKIPEMVKGLSEKIIQLESELEDRTNDFQTWFYAYGEIAKESLQLESELADLARQRKFDEEVIKDLQSELKSRIADRDRFGERMGKAMDDLERQNDNLKKRITILNGGNPYQV